MQFKQLLAHLKSFASAPKSYILSYLNYRYSHDFWQNEDGHNADYEERNIIIANMVEPNSSVFEFGAGQGFLPKHLPEGCEYQPCDLYPTTEETIVCNLNESFPQMKKKYDYIVLSGVIEYVHDLESLFQNVHANCQHCLVSYAPMDKLSCMITRICWVNHLWVSDLEALFKRHGFEIERKETWQRQFVYALRSIEQTIEQAA